MDAALGDLSGWLGFRVSIPENPAGGHLPRNTNLPASSSLHSLDCFVSCWFAFGVCLFVCLGTAAYTFMLASNSLCSLCL